MSLLDVEVVRSLPRNADATVAIGLPVGAEGPVARQLGLSRAALVTHGFEGKPGQTLVLPGTSGPTLIAVGVGQLGGLGPAELRNAAASFVRAAGKRAVLVTTLADLAGADARAAGQAVVE